MSSRRDIHTWYDANRFNLLFIAMVMLIMIPPFLPASKFVGILIYILISFVILNALLIIFSTHARFKLGLIIATLMLSYIWIVQLAVQNNPELELLSNLLLIILFGVAFTRIIGAILRMKKISARVVVGGIGAYLLLGLIGAFFFGIIEILYPGSFTNSDVFQGFYSEIYLSFVTISTLGYGDITPLTAQGQAAAILVSVTGQLYLAILMAMLVGKFLKDTDW